ncbi:MAG: hypothetical protein HQL98_09405 [Magnetococcales bacterium]|nr:hypothetical protein [Magnetococcales bacterium]
MSVRITDRLSLDLISEKLRNRDDFDPVGALANHDLRLEVISPLQPQQNARKLHEVIDPFVQVLRNGGSMDPGEIKSTEDFVSEFLDHHESRIAIIVSAIGMDVDGKALPPVCVTGAIGATLAGRTDQRAWACNLLEYCGTALHVVGSGTGLGTLAVNLYLHEARKVADSMQREFIGLLIESVESATGFWNAIGSRAFCRRVEREGNEILEALSYAMPTLPGEDGVQPDTGLPRADGQHFFRELITLLPDQPKENHFSGQMYKQMIGALYDSSYRPKRAYFLDDAAYETAVRFCERTLHEVCIDHVSDQDTIYFYSDEDVRASGLSAYKWKSKEFQHRFLMDRPGCTGEYRAWFD